MEAHWAHGYAGPENAIEVLCEPHVKLLRIVCSQTLVIHLPLYDKSGFQMLH